MATKIRQFLGSLAGGGRRLIGWGDGASILNQVIAGLIVAAVVGAFAVLTGFCGAIDRDDGPPDPPIAGPTLDSADEQTGGSTSSTQVEVEPDDTSAADRERGAVVGLGIDDSQCPEPPHHRQVTVVDWSGGGLLAAGACDGSINIWDGSGAWVQVVGAGAPVTDLAWSPSGERLAVTADFTVSIFPVANGRLEEPEVYPDLGRLLAWVDDEGLAVAAWRDIRLLDTADGAVVPTRYTQTEPAIELWAVTASLDGDRLVAGDNNGRIHVWAFNEPATPDVHDVGSAGQRIQSLSWDGEGRLVSGGLDGVLRFWRWPEMEIDQEPGEKENGSSVAWSPDADRFAVAGGSDLVRVFSSVEPIADPVALEGHNELTGAVTWGPDPDRLASGGWDGAVIMWTLEDGRPPDARRLERR